MYTRSDMELPRVKILRGTVLGKKVLAQGAIVPLAFVIEQLPELLAVRAVTIEPPKHPSGYGVLLRNLPEGEAYEVLPLEDLPPHYEKRGWVIPLDDAELSDLHHCGDCLKVYFLHSALQKHKKETGHKRQYKKKSLDEEKQTLEDKS
jgi:hypothetical protein